LFLLSIAPVWGQLVLSDSCNVSGGDSSSTGFGVNVGANYQISSRLSGTASNGLSYLETTTGANSKAASSYSIKTNRIYVAVAANPGRFTFTANGTSPKDLGVVLGSDSATPADPVIYELAVKMSNQSGNANRTSFGISTFDTGVQDWNLGIQFVNNGADLDIYRRIDGASNPSGGDYNDVIATLAGQARAEVDLRLRITDAGAESSTGHFNSHYEVFANGTLVFASATNDFRFASSPTRLILFDTAGNSGPVTYDDFSLALLSATNPPVVTNNLPLKIVSHRLLTNGFEFSWSSQTGSNYTILKSTNLNASPWTFISDLRAASTNSTLSVPINQTVATYYRVAQLAQSGLSLSSVTATQRVDSGLVDIFYDLADLYQGPASVSVLISTDGGATYHAAAASFSGDAGSQVLPGHLHIVWDAGADWSSLAAGNVRVKIIADRAPISPDMAFVPAGTFSMGDSKSEGLACESPVHSVNVSALYVGRYEVTKSLWDEVAQWATNHGYSFESPGVGTVSNFPVQQISWYDAVKWCNARSEKENLSPAYFVNQAWTAVYRTGQVDLAEANVRWQGAGYRLLTEAEWEKAARGGLSGKRFPLADTITHDQANYWSTSFESFDVNGTEGSHPLAQNFPNLLPVGSFRPSGYGLYDMAGNIWEWCWDYYGDTWYADARASNQDTHGPTSASWGGDRVYRGGAGVDIAWKSRVANRADAPPRFAMGHFGFRVAMPTGESLVSAESSVFSLTP
jgi:formylglycine-generating enzyme required for sulfatase activity